MRYALLVAVTILVAIVTPLDPPIPIAQQAQAIQRTTNLSTSPPQTQWNSTYGGNKSDWAYSVQQTADGGYVVAGYTLSFGAGSYDFWLVKTDSAGSEQWNKTYGGNYSDQAYCVQQTSDGGYILAGTADLLGSAVNDAWLVKTDSAGNQQWNSSYGGTDEDCVYSAQQTPDGGYVLAGYTITYAGLHAWLVRTNSTGNLQWSRTYGGVGDYWAYSVQQTSDGGYILAGYTNSAGSFDFWLVKTDSAGSEQWSRTYGGTGEDQAYSVGQTSDGGYILTGYTGSFGAGSYDFWLVKTDSVGSEQWNKTYGGTGTDQANSVHETSDGGYIVAGYTTSFGAGSYDFWVVRTDPAGSEQWNKTYGGTGIDRANSLHEASDGGYIVAGVTNSLGAGILDFWLLKTSDGTAPSAVTDLTADSPTSDSVILVWTAPGDSGMKGKATGYVVRYSTTGSITADNWSSATEYQQSWEPAENGTTEIHAITGLASGTRYWFAVETYDDVSFYGEVSNSPSITTLPDTTPPATITLFLTDSPTSTSVALTWVAPGDDGYTGNASGYVVKYSTTGPIDSGNWNSASIYIQSWVPLRNNTVETHTLTGLTPGTTYWFAVEAYDDVPNYGAVSNSPSATTKASDTIVPATITDLQTVARTSTSVTITWTAPGDEGMNGNATGYMVKYSTTGRITASNWSSATTYPQTWTPAKNGSTETHVITGLSPGTEYWFAVEAYDEMLNYSEVSNSPNAVTSMPPETTAPAAIADLAAGTATSTSVVLTWTAPGNDGMKGDATGYIVKYSATGPITADNWSSATTYQQSWTPAKNGTAETHTVTDLTPGAKYWFAVVAFDEVPNYSGVSNSPSATTGLAPDTTAPAVIADLAASTATSTSITLTWTAPGDNGYVGNATGYIVKYSTVGPIDSGNWNSASVYTQFWTPVRNGTLETHMVTGLTSGTKYWFAVETYDDVLIYSGVSNSPNAMTATTTTATTTTTTTSTTTTTPTDTGSLLSGQMVIVVAAVGAVILVFLVVLYLRKR